MSPRNDRGVGCRRIRLLGRPAASIDDGPIGVPEKGFALVALLALADGSELGRESVREMLWENAPNERRPGSLRQLLSRLNRLAKGSPLVVATGGTLRLATDAWRIDVSDLLAPVAPEARALASDSLLEGISVDGRLFEDWLGEARRRVDDRRGAILRTALARPSLDPADEVAFAERLTALDPLDEAPYRVLMSAHARAGDGQAARGWWLGCLGRLHEDLGVRPSEETRQLALRLGLDRAPATVPSAEEQRPVDPLGIPTVVVMPPAMLPGNALLDRFGLVVLEEITLGLSQFGSFRVIAAYTSWQLSRREAMGAGLAATGSDYGVTIGIRDSREPLSATCRLTKLSTDEVLWSVEMEVRADNLQASLNDLVRRTVASLAAAVERAEGRAAPGEYGATGYRMYLEGKRSIGTTGLESLRAARKWFRAAVRRCDEFSAAFAGLSRSLSMEWLVRGMTDNDLLDDALVAAKRAYGCDPASGRALREIGFANLYLRRHEESLGCFAQARPLSPHDADLLADYADALLHDGQPEKALELMGDAKRLNPLGPDYYKWIEASILYQIENYEKAVQVLLPIAESPATARLMAASCAMAGDADAAHRHAARVREHYPDFRVEQIWRIMPDRRPADTRQLALGLQKAGLD